MNERIIGKIKRVNGPVLIVKGIQDARMMGWCTSASSASSVKWSSSMMAKSYRQVYEDATGLRPDDNVYGSGMSLSV